MTGVPRLSVVSFTNGPIPLVAASLERVRSLAADIVVAVDARVDPEELGPLVAVADRVVRAEYVTPFEANLAWLDSLATGDWVLQLDGDDVVSDALLDRLATPGWDDGITHAYATYRWIWPTPDRMLYQGPWWPDPVLRLFRTTPGVTRYPSTTHSGRQAVGDHRFLDEAIYHLDLVLNSLPRREAKVDVYERATPGHRTERGWAVSPTLYLPEHHLHRPRTTPVPGGDAHAIRSVLAAVDGNGSAVAPAVRPRTVIEGVVEASVRQAPPPATGAIGLRLVDHQPVGIVAGLPATITIGVSNRTERRMWPHDVPATQLGARLQAADGSPAGPELRAPLPGPIGPGDEALVRLVIPAALPDGSVIVEVGALQEGIAWFDTWLRVELDVRPGRRVVVATSPEPEVTRRTAVLLTLLARDLPDVVPSIVQVEPGPITLDGNLPLIDAREDLDPHQLIERLGSILPPPPPLT
ncbi:MAG: hypothetical protein ACR2MB_17095 [Acidimicrobiales bacterium]